ncbi:hypothetical protein [Streptococcus infantis]|uniref:Uncharacterized protein n=1 Tax=Streptococcus infantis SPAR10 TaxID=1159208 RepID=J0YJL5_9STRE|nr:hypothetical protein [Streptococcus infantis]EJG87581.1 hypothetical protein SPAR10_1154 [Streptococcus infantis SPAR10]SIA75522.1 Uncharacterised protein [Mycobacteroides abscessus subsp. abscessus]
MRKHLNIFRILYLLFLVFALIHFVLGLFGLAFTPVLWNTWFFGLCLTLFIHPWTIFYKSRIFQWHHLIFQALSGFFALIIWFVIFFVLSVVPDSSMPINIDYQINNKDKEIRIIRGFLLHEIHEYHDLVNPLIMKSKVKYKIEN